MVERVACERVGKIETSRPCPVHFNIAVESFGPENNLWIPSDLYENM